MKSKTSEIKKFNIWSVARIFVVIGVVIGLLQGISFGLAAQQTRIVSPQVASMSFSDVEIAGNPEAMMGLALIKVGYWAILIMPIVMAVIYSLGGMLSALIYNLIAAYWGGIKVVLN